MSKRNRNKFRNRESSSAHSSSHESSAAAPAAVRASGAEGALAQHTAEYRVISRDLIRLVVLNGLMLIALFALYYVNKQSGIVEQTYHRLF